MNRMEVFRMTKVLVVDDNPSLPDVVVFILTMHQTAYEVATASNGEDGLELVMIFHPDVAIIDVMMPHLNGYQLIRALRGDPATAHIPLIILSALAQKNDIITGEYAGADIYLTKPQTPQELVTAIEEALHRSAADRQHRLQEIVNQAEAVG